MNYYEFLRIAVAHKLLSSSAAVNNICPAIEIGYV